MAKSDIRIEQAHTLIERLAQELGLLVSDTSFGKKVQGPGNRHRMYVQKGVFLGRIDTTVPIPNDDPAYVGLTSHIGNIHCHVTPNLEQLERVLRMLADSSLEKQVVSRPRPFAPTKAPRSRQPKPVVEPVPAAELEEPITGERDPREVMLAERVAAIRQQARAARIRMVLENPEKYGRLSEEEAAALVDGRGRVETDDLVEAARNTVSAETREVLEETGIEVAS